MTPTDNQIQLLREVIGGKKAFVPRSRSDEDMNEFQVLASMLIELGENNYLTSVRPHRESQTGRRQIDYVLVEGVTAKGERSAQAKPTPIPTDINLDGTDVLCPNCNRLLREKAKFCDDCGFSLSPSVDTIPNEPTPAPAPADSFLGRVLQSKYQIISEIGSGGMGHVYSARHLGLRQDVAIKIIHKKFVSDANAIERFKREAVAAAQLKHPNVIDIMDIDETVEPDRRPYIVMELVRGKSLKTVLETEGKLTVDRAVALMIEICKAVSFAHRQNVIHRDIKPDNIMVIQRDGEAGESIKVLDFGLAKILESDEPSITLIGTLLGTPYYMSPEQCRCEELDARSDVYSLATVLYEMLSGRTPFSGSNLTQVCSKHQLEAVPAFDPALKVPDGVVKVINQGLAKNRDERPASAQQFSQDLQNAYASFSEIRKKAAMAETLEDKKSKAP